MYLEILFGTPQGPAVTNRDLECLIWPTLRDVIKYNKHKVGFIVSLGYAS